MALHSTPARLPDSEYAPLTLVDLLRWRAANNGEWTAYRFLNDGEVSVQATITYAELDTKARAIAAWLQSQGAHGQRALLLYPPGLDYIAAFFGCLYAGVVAVPAYPPRLNRPMPRLQAIVKDSGATVGLTVTSIHVNLERRFEHEPDMAALHWLDTDALQSGSESAWREPDIHSQSLAFLQYTSGSTSTPKGVMLSHGNLLSNLELIRVGFRIEPRGVGVFWLPSYHDMGLIGGVLEPMYIGGPSTLMSPASFLQRPLRWLEAIQQYGGTISGAPNFAYDMCVEKSTAEQRAALDLRNWQTAFSGAEPIRRETLERFAEAFAPSGFRRAAFYPCYGLAEATLIVSGGDGPGEPVYHAIDRKALANNKAVIVPPGAESAQWMVSSGRALLDQKIAIVDSQSFQRCADGDVGEVWVSGGSVAQGYWGKPELTALAFGARIAGEAEDRAYLRTGDLGFLREGELFITGRVKDLIIIRGRNHYPQDIELTVEQCHEALQPAGGAAFSVDVDGEERLVVVQEISRHARNANKDEVIAAIRRAVATEHELQIYAIVLIKPLSVSKTSSGKIQRHACKAAFIDGTLEVVQEWRAPLSPRPDGPSAAKPAAAPRALVSAGQRAIEAWLVSAISQRLNIAPSDIEVREPFTFYGLDSAQAVSIAGDLGEWLGRQLPPTLAWDYPTIELLAAQLASDEPAQPGASPGQDGARPPTTNEPIAIVGLSCRFPGANNANEFWQLLRDGVDAIREVPPDRWNADEYYHTDPGERGKMITRWGGFLDRVDLFDAAFFGISPREASRMDPQQRLLMEVAWEALESAGIPPHALSGSDTGVFIGISSYDYSGLQFDNPTLIDAYAGTGNAHSIAANRLSYTLDLRGPSMAIDTACSSSLVAVHLACQSLRSGECDTALAGGVNLILSPELTITFSQARMMAADGRCKTFDERADGYVRGEGCGVVALKRLSEARRDGDNILAVIRGSAVNQDGKSNGLTAPNGLAQQEVIRRALKVAGLQPSALSYIEAHGTGTPLGDPIEIGALRAVLETGEPRPAPCRVGSVKTNIGHLESAAGVAGLIKVVLSLQHGELPPHLHLQSLNPHLPLQNAPLKIVTAREAWQGGPLPRVAGISSFGFGGTNAHLIIEEAPPSLTRSDTSHRPLHLLALSARSGDAVRQLAHRYADALPDDPAGLADFCYSVNSTRAHHAHRAAIFNIESVQSLRAELLALAEEAGSSNRHSGKARTQRLQIAFLFTGQGAQHADMGRALYHASPVFRQAFDACDAAMRPMLNESLVSILYDGSSTTTDINQTAIAQPALFALEVALCHLWRSWGIEPAAVMGHSVGEFAAAVAAGVLSLEDGARLIAGRGRLMQALPDGGAMAAVFAAQGTVAAAVAPYADQLAIAAINNEENTVISGAAHRVHLVCEQLSGQGVRSQPLKVSHAFHSPLMQPMLDDFHQLALGMRYAPPTLSYISTLTGAPLTAAPDARYWRDHVSQPVRFAPGVAALSAMKIDAVIEIGPAPVLIGLCQFGAGWPGFANTAWLPSLHRAQPDWQVALGSLAKLYTLGADPDWRGFEAGDSRQRHSLPTYPFERQRYWLESTRRRPHATDLPHPEPDDAPPTDGPQQAAGMQPGTEREAILAAPEASRAERLQAYLQTQVAQALGLPAARLDVDHSLGGLGFDSLMATQLKNKIQIELGIDLPIVTLLQGPTTAELAALLLPLLSGEATTQSISHLQSPDGQFSLSHNQESFWLLRSLAPDEVGFNVAGALRVKGKLDVAALQRSLDRVLTRHEALRTRFIVRPDDAPFQQTLDNVTLPIEMVDATGWKDETLRAHLRQRAWQRFDESLPPLMRVVLYRRARNDHVLLISVDHLVTDFWSMSILAQELTLAYTAETGGAQFNLPHPTVTYADYVHWHADRLGGADGERLLAYWREQLSGELPVLDLPTDAPYRTVPSYESDSRTLMLGAPLLRKLKRLGQARGGTLFTVLLTAYQTLLHRATGQNDLIVGTVTTGRAHPQLAATVGYMINPVAVRSTFYDTPTFAALLAQTRTRMLGAFEHQDYPPAKLAEHLTYKRLPGRPPLFQTMFILQKAQVLDDAGFSALALGLDGVRLKVPIKALQFETIHTGHQPDQFELTLMMAEVGGRLGATLHFNAHLFQPQRIERFLAQFERLLHGIAADPDQPITHYDLLTPAERRTILKTWNRTAATGKPATIQALFERQARRAPNRIAAEFDGARLSYAELNDRAERLARYLRRKGVRREALVGVCLHRSLDMLVSVLGVLKAGGAYVPIDPAFPDERIAFMAQDSGLRLMLTQQSLLGQLSPLGRFECIAIDAEWETMARAGGRGALPKVSPSQLAYVIYTSGSTGKPKGVQVEHRSVSNFLRSMRQQPRLSARDVLLAVTTLSFDIAALELFLPLTVGAKVIIASRETATDAMLLADLLARSRATVMQATPATWRMLREAGWRGTAKFKALCGGEALPPELAQWLSGIVGALWNLYGPTETTIWSTRYRVREVGEIIPIGNPIANTQVYVLDADRQPVPVGVAGELYIGGAGVARGYWNRADLTDERFVPDPFNTRRGARLYRTGDMARWQPDGTLVYLGRADFQVKVRGFRIELGEIEAAMQNHPAVRQAVAVVHGEQIAGYVALREGEDVTGAALRDHAATFLPDYMVPHAVIILPDIPLTANGKVDRQALPSPATVSGARPAYVAPRTALEEALCEMCAATLNLEQVGVHDSFFDLGGHSLSATRLIAKLRETYQVKIPLRVLFENPTVAGLAKAIETARLSPEATGGLFAAMSIEMLNAEVSLDRSIGANGLRYLPTGAPGDILLTGATGFLGAFLLSDLCQHTGDTIHCLVRAGDEAQAMQRLKRNLESYGLWHERMAGRVKAVPGDLAMPRLGLSHEAFNALAETVQAIYHNGALVNFVHSYGAHKPSNVSGTKEVLRLACTHSLKPVHFVSTLSVLHTGGHDDGRVFGEDVDLDEVGVPFGGYAQSKWVAEKLVVEAGRRGIPYAIYRPGMVSGDSRTGAWNSSDMMSTLAGACVAVRAVPDLNVKVNVVPVDFVSRAIVRLSRETTSLGKVFHLANPSPMPFAQLVQWLESLGVSVTRIPFERWRAELAHLAQTQPDHGAALFLPLLEEVEEGQVFMPDIECRNTLTGLQNTDVACPPVAPELLTAYFNYFALTGVFKDGNGNSAGR